MFYVCLCICILLLLFITFCNFKLLFLSETPPELAPKEPTDNEEGSKDDTPFVDGGATICIHQNHSNLSGCMSMEMYSTVHEKVETGVQFLTNCPGGDTKCFPLINQPFGRKAKSDDYK